jgi:hypothetical protein
MPTHCFSGIPTGGIGDAVTTLECMTFKTADSRADIGGHAAKDGLRIKAALDRKIRATALPGVFEMQHRAGFESDGATQVHGDGIGFGLQVGAGDGKPLRLFDA